MGRSIAGGKGKGKERVRGTEEERGGREGSLIEMRSGVEKVIVRRRGERVN